MHGVEGSNPSRPAPMPRGRMSSDRILRMIVRMGRMPQNLALLAMAAFCLAVAATARADDPAAKAQQLEFFEAKIRPVLVDKCYSCHSETSKKLKGDLKVDTAAGLLRGGESGAPSVVPGNLEK